MGVLRNQFKVSTPHPLNTPNYLDLSARDIH
jgi:hypothetical protein